MKKRKQSRKTGRVNMPETIVRIVSLAVILFLTGRIAAAEELLPEEGSEQPEKTEVVIVLRPVKEEGEPDPDLSEEIRNRISEQLSEVKEECLDRLCACVSWEYDYSGSLTPPGTDRPAGESDIRLSFSDDPEYAFSGWHGEPEETSEEPGADKGSEEGSFPGETTDPGEETPVPEETGGPVQTDAGPETVSKPEESIRDRLRSYLTTRPKEKPDVSSEESGTDPPETEPETTDPPETDPSETEPGTTDPQETDLTEPETGETGPEEPGPQEPISAEPDPEGSEPAGSDPAEPATAEDPAAGPAAEPEPAVPAAEPEPEAPAAAEAAVPASAVPASTGPVPVYTEPVPAVSEGVATIQRIPKETKKDLKTPAEQKAEKAEPAETGSPGTKAAEVRTEIRLIRTEKDREVDLTDQYREILAQAAPESIDWRTILDPLPENDGMYTLRVTNTDRRGTAVTKDMTFSVNRFGSVYAYDSTIQSLRGKIIRNVKAPLIISEYNPDPLEPESWKLSLTHDGQAVDQVLYTISRRTEEKTGQFPGMEGWYRYDYIIDPDNFREDGVYRLSVSSRDTAGNRPETNRYNGGEIAFTVDSTPPELQDVKGLEQPVVNGQTARIRITAFDAVGLSEAAVYSNGTCLGKMTEFDDQHRAEMTVRVPEGESQKIRIVLTDSAGNRLDTEEKNKKGEYLFRPGFPFQRTLSVIPETGMQTGKSRWLAFAAAVLSCACAGAWLLRKSGRKDSGPFSGR